MAQKNHTVNASQIAAAASVLERLRRLLAPEFLGLISTGGHPLILTVIPRYLDADAFSSLAASSFAATSALAGIMDEQAFTAMFQEGKHLNVHIAQISEAVLLVVCFQKDTQIGKVRLVTARAIAPLARVFNAPGTPQPQVKANDGSKGRAA